MAYVSSSVLMIGILLSGLASFGQGSGMVMDECQSEIEEFCADKQHGHGEVRACLEAKKSVLSETCKKALDTTGPHKGRRQGKKKAN